MSELIFYLAMAFGIFGLGFAYGWLWGTGATLKALRPQLNNR